MKQAMNGLFPKFTPQHQLMAGRVLAILCIEQGIEFVESVKKPSVPRTRDSAQRKVIGDEIDAALSAAEEEIAGYVKKLTGGGRRMIRFLIEAMEGGIKSFSPSLRIAAGKELIGYAYPIFVPASARDAKPGTASSSEPSPASEARPESAPVGVSVGQALLMYEDKYCQNDLNINASIVRRTLERSNDPEAQRAEARRLWNEKEDFLKAQCPTISPEPYPAWFDKILDSSGADVPSAVPDDPDDWWDDEDWELCEIGLCAEDDLPCPYTTVPLNPEDP
ncbi:MAG: hypothetical protein F4Y49_09825 [Dehalococcoidia bacterium]|nr:hypothetical protein [Dehalococcoidia bacterium]